MSRNDDSTKENYQNYYKLIAIDLSRKTNMNISQKINFTGKLEDDGATMFFIAEKQQKTLLIFSLDSLFQNNINNGTSKNIKLIE